jgi:para-nitrobenzyl esterase
VRYAVRIILAILGTLGLAARTSPASLAAAQADGPVVRTTGGLVRGEIEKDVLVFRGIRFAAPPVGPLRFRPPMPPSPWNDVEPALDFAPACPQLVAIDLTENNNSVMAEDCLALNIWTPHVDAKKRPVMVWIHGGGFVGGSARNTWYDGAALSARGDVVVVTLQYRLGAWGFLELSEIGGYDYAESGNVGLLDQIAGLKWVKQNIQAFGGDPDKVTLFGQSAGAGSIGMLMTLPTAAGLFQKAILESGTPKDFIENGFVARVRAVGVVYWSPFTSITACL